MQIGLDAPGCEIGMVPWVFFLVCFGIDWCPVVLLRLLGRTSQTRLLLCSIFFSKGVVCVCACVCGAGYSKQTALPGPAKGRATRIPKCFPNYLERM